MKKIYSKVLLITGILSALLYIFLHNRVSVPLLMVLKTIPTINMCLWMLSKKLDKYRIFIFIGIVLSMLCDVFMLLNMVTVGMLFNMIALVFYTIYFVRSDPSLDLLRVIPFTVILTLFYIILYPNLAENTIPVLIYCILYTIFLWRSSARIGEEHISPKSQWVCFIGCVLLAGSDFLLSLMLFSLIPHSDLLYSIVMVCWWSGLFALMLTAELKRQIYIKLRD